MKHIITIDIDAVAPKLCGVSCPYLNDDEGAVSCDLFNEMLERHDEESYERDSLCLDSGSVGCL